jgi:Uma2 family endonuclease
MDTGAPEEHGMVATKQKMTIEEFAAIEEDGRFDLIDGELHVVPAWIQHGEPASNIHGELRAFAKSRKLGKTYIAEATFVLGPGTALAPDVAFLRMERVPTPDYEGFYQGAPDLAVEVVSPSETGPMVARKVARYLEAGTSIVWCVHQRRREVVVHRPGHESVTLGEGDVLDGGDVLPGFALPVAEIFE